uniref:cytochrome c oxidase assembly protein n=1 Tax=Paractinoplanes polyasparticus TaxID=2856853 RepID=UPI001C85BB9D|nr:cytochrome c oxidase assembly protein [Actinoplanes polyasparticus]
MSGRILRLAAVGGGALAATAVSVLLLRYGGAIDTRTLPGLPNPGMVTVWGLPVARLGSRLFAVATVGLLLAAALLSPREGGRLSVSAYRRLRASLWTGLGWTVCALTQAAFTLADLLGRPVQELTVSAAASFVRDVPLGRALLTEAALAFLAVMIARLALRPDTAWIALATAVAALVPPVFTGHAASASNHQAAVSALLIHVIAVTLWAGGLLALLLSARVPNPQLTMAVRRFSTVATGCITLVAASGLVSALVRLPNAGTLFLSSYGQIVLLKVVLLLVLAGIGAWQRRAIAPLDRNRFHRLAGAEVVLFALTVGVSVALSRTPSPAGEAEETAATSLLGFPMPPPITTGHLLTDWLPDPLIIALAIGAAAAYVVGFLRLRRRGASWPAGRMVAFLAGCAVLVVATGSGVARYAPLLISVHVLQHLALLMVAPLLLVVGAPASLVLRAWSPAADPSWPGPRELVQAVVRSRRLAMLSQPNVVLVLFAGSTFALYVTGLYDLVLRSHAAHLVMVAVLTGTGCLFFRAVLSARPLPRSVRIGLIGTATALYIVFGVALTQYGQALAADWHTALARPWGPTPEADQRTAGWLALAAAVPLLAALALVLRRRPGNRTQQTSSPRQPADVSP